LRRPTINFVLTARTGGDSDRTLHRVRAVLRLHQGPRRLSGIGMTIAEYRDGRFWRTLLHTRCKAAGGSFSCCWHKVAPLSQCEKMYAQSTLTREDPQSNVSLCIQPANMTNLLASILVCCADWRISTTRLQSARDRGCETVGRSRRAVVAAARKTIETWERAFGGATLQATARCHCEMVDALSAVQPPALRGHLER